MDKKYTQNDLSTTTICFTDGASRGNPGLGGWGAVVIVKDNSGETRVIERGGFDAYTTNNAMEMTAVVAALTEAVAHKNKNVEIFTDSSYLINGITKWIHGWKKNGWKTKTGDDVKNSVLWEEIDTLVSKLDVTFTWVAGHSGTAGNERCDAIATQCAYSQIAHNATADLEVYQNKITQLFDSDGVLHIVPHDATSARKKSSSNAKAHSYVSMVDGQIQTHATWADCEARVKGTKGARYKKALSAEDETKLIKEFGGTK